MGNLFVRSSLKTDVPSVADSTSGDGGGQPPIKQWKCSGLDRVAASTSRHADGGESTRDQPHQRNPKMELTKTDLLKLVSYLEGELQARDSVIATLKRAELPVVEEPAAEFEDLPDEVVIRILSYLTVEEILEITQHVCRRWHRLSHDPEVWRNKTYCIDSKCSDRKAANKLEQMQQLCSLEIKKNVREKVINVMIQHCTQLTHLQLAYCQRITHHMLENLVQQCPKIKSLSITTDLLSEENKAKTVANLKELQALTVEIGSDNMKIHLRPLADSCPNLHSLEVSEMISVFGEDLEYFLSIKCESLSRLALPWAMDFSNGTRCTVPLLRDCTALSYLQLTDCRTYDETPEAFDTLGLLSNLRTLIVECLDRCPVREVARAFESGLSWLEVLRMTYSSIEDAVVVAVCQHCQNLKELRLDHCREITDDALRFLHRLSKLEMLDLSGCGSLRGKSLPYVAQVAGLKSLYLDFLNMRKLKSGLGRILDLTSLEMLSFNYSSNLSLFPFGNLAGKLLHLRELNLKQCLEDESVLRRLREQMPDLKVDFEPIKNDHFDTESSHSDSNEEQHDQQ